MNFINRRNFLYGMGMIALAPLAKAFPAVPFKDTPLKNIYRLDKFCFGSCNHQDRDQVMWSRVLNESPDLFMWLGDTVYCDTEKRDELIATYKKQKENLSYQKILANMPVVGIWDDHDFGQNNSDHTNPLKDLAQESFLDFIDEPLDSPRRRQKGIYTSYEIGPQGEKVKIILLDLRYHRNKDSEELLGDKQWEWLEEEFKNSTAQIHLVATSSPFVAPKLMFADHWEDFEKDNKKFMKLIDKYDPSGLFFLTGDQHMAGFFTSKTPGGIPLFEVMSSGLTHHTKRRFKAYLNMKYGKENYFIDKNFGITEIFWNQNNIVMDVKVRGKNPKRQLVRKLHLRTNHFVLDA